MTAQDLLEDRHRPQAGRSFEERHDLGLEHLGERIGPSSAAWGLLGRGQARIGADAMAGGGTEGGLGGGRGDAVALTELHEEPHLVIGHMAAGHGQAPRREGPCSSPAGRSHQTAWPLGGSPTPI